MEGAARQFLRAVRGRRSQVSFSRELVYRSHVAAKWERGQRMPEASEALRACQVVGIDLLAACQQFHTASAPDLRTVSDASVAAWLRALHGERTLTEIAYASSLSRYQVSRCLAGSTRPSLPAFFQLLDGITSW